MGRPVSRADAVANSGIAPKSVRAWDLFGPQHNEIEDWRIWATVEFARFSMGGGRIFLSEMMTRVAVGMNGGRPCIVFFSPSEKT